MTDFIHGFDVSHFQDVESFRWDEMAQQKVFLIARASYGARTADRAFVKFAEAARHHEIRFGAYHFYRQIHSVEEQLALFERQLDAAGGLRAGDFFPVLDMEENAANGDGRPVPATFSNGCQKLAEAFASKYGGVILYYSSFFPEYLGAPRVNRWTWMRENCRLHWLADYNKPAGDPRHPYTTVWSMHQPRPTKSPLYMRDEVVDQDVARADLFELLLIPETSSTISVDAEVAEKGTTARPGGALRMDQDTEALKMLQQGSELLSHGFKLLGEDEGD